MYNLTKDLCSLLTSFLPFISETTEDIRQPEGRQEEEEGRRKGRRQ
jgi:hypothetical protein